MPQDISLHFKTICMRRPPHLCTNTRNMTRDYLFHVSGSEHLSRYYMQHIQKNILPMKTVTKGFNINPNFLPKLSLDEFMTAANTLYIFILLSPVFNYFCPFMTNILTGINITVINSIIFYHQDLLLLRFPWPTPRFKSRDFIQNH
jgi:hypothetical protein